MNIPDKVYENLTPAERIRAAVLASARDDERELTILKETCPKKAYLVTDPAYSEVMMKLFSLLLFIEYQLTSYALDFQVSRLRKGQERCDAQESALMGTASVVAALNQLITEMGLDPVAMAQNGPPRHPLVTATITVSEGEEDPELVEFNLQHMREQLAA